MIFYGIVILVYDGDGMKRILNYGICLFLCTFLLISNVYAGAEDIAVRQIILSFFIYTSPILITILVVIISWRRRQVERRKENVEDRNHTGAHGALDSRNVKDREFMEYIEETEDKTDKLLANYFDNLTDLEFIKSHSSEALYNNIVNFIKTNEKEDKYIVVKDTVVNSNEIKTKDGNIFSTDVIIECYNYIEDSRGHYICGYKINKEFVRKRIEFSYNNKDIFIISIENM